MTKAQKIENEDSTANKKKCGIIMPIASTDGYPSEHWKDVLLILTEAIQETEFESRLVSDDVAIGLIHDRIVTNIYNDEIVVCDVSSKNPNVMFELGLRLAFDKPTIIIKDEKTGYSFDTGVIEHLSYPSSLRFSQIVDFKSELARRITATYKKSKQEPNFSPFLKSFGKTIVPASIQQTEIPEGRFIMEQLDMLRHELRLMRVERKNEDIPISRKPFTINENVKKNLLREFVAKYSVKNRTLSESELIEIIRNQYSKHGLNMSLREIQELLKNTMQMTNSSNSKHCPTNTKMNMRTEPFERTLQNKTSELLATGARIHFTWTLGGILGYRT